MDISNGLKPLVKKRGQGKKCSGKVSDMGYYKECFAIIIMIETIMRHYY